ncbi:MAG TPA: Lcl C-terminal domain-containing protein [Xylella sp.]
MNAAPARFTKILDDYGKHIITRDEKTGLEWAACSFGLYSNKLHDSEAEKGCRAVRIGGHGDWRLPTVDELLTLVDRSRYHPATDVDAFPNVVTEGFFRYWTSTPIQRIWQTNAWMVDLAYGECISGLRELVFGVIPVRGSLDHILRGTV